MSDEKPMELRDQFALHILNAIIDSQYAASLRNDNYKDWAQKEQEIIIRQAYQMADMMRKIRLTTFE